MIMLGALDASLQDTDARILQFGTLLDLPDSSKRCLQLYDS